MAEIEKTITVSLEEFEIDDIIEYLEDEGYSVEGGEDDAPVKTREDAPIDPYIDIRNDKLMLREHLIKVLGCGHFVSNQTIVKSLEELL